MRKRCAGWLFSVAVVSGLTLMPVKGDDWPTLPDWATLPEWPWRHKADLTGPNSLFQIARSLDDVEEKIRDDGIITTKQPDVWSQQSMTKYRKDFEAQMQASLSKFEFILSARVSRTDQASLKSQTALAASLTPVAAGGGGGGATRRGGGASTAVTSPTTVIALPSASDVINERNAQQQIANNLLAQPDTSITAAAPFSYLPGGKPFQNVGEAAGQLGLEPNELMNQKQSYLDHLNDLRRINLGADNADAAGYGLYLVRVPVSIQPGEGSYKGHGASMIVTAKHEFGPRFLPETFRMFVINDLVDTLTPVVFEMIRSGYLDQLERAQDYLNKGRALEAELRRKLEQQKRQLESVRANTALLQESFNVRMRQLAPIIAHFGAEIARFIADAASSSVHDAKGGGVPGERRLRRENAPRLREAIALLRQMLNLIPPQPDVARGLRILASMDDQLREYLNREADDASPLRPQLDGDAAELRTLAGAGLEAALHQGLVDGLTFTSKGRPALETLARLGELFDRLFVPPPEEDRESRSSVFHDFFYSPDEISGLRSQLFNAQVFNNPALSSQLMVSAGAVATYVVTPSIAMRDLTQKISQQLRQIDDILNTSFDAFDRLGQLGADVAQLPAQIAAAEVQVNQLSQPPDFKKVIATFLPLSRTGTNFYPVALTDYDDVFLVRNFDTMATETNKALLTRSPRFSDVRSFLKREIEGAYDLLPYFETFIEDITCHVEVRDNAALLADFSRMTMALPGDLRGRTNDPLVALCWTIAIDAGLLNRYIRLQVKNRAPRLGPAADDPDRLVFYWHDYLPEAPEPGVFQDLIKEAWPILAYSVDPAVDEQNIDEASAVHRDLQLALAFSFAAGRLSFNQLDRFNRRLEYQAETIALNQMVTSFTQGKATFGWRFYPRFQNPPPEGSNLRVLSNLLLRGGEGPNYQMNQSKLEPGRHELTAVIVMPSFVPYVRFESTGNWFWLHDPEQLVVPTDRMLRQSQNVAVLKRELDLAEDCGHFREDDLRQLTTRVEQVAEILPMQTHKVNVPYSDVSGFELFTPVSGSQALVPQVLGYDGADYIDPSKETDLIIYGKRFSILETQVVVGGKYLTRDPINIESSRMDMISRDVMRVLIPAGSQPTVIRDGKRYVELVVSTPNGVSNRFQIPYGPPSSPPAVPEPLAVDAGYSLMDDLLKVGATLTPATPQQAQSGQGGASIQPTTTIQTTQTIQVTQGGSGGQGGGSGGQGGAGGGQGGASGGGQAGSQAKLTVAPTNVAKGMRIRILPGTAATNPSGTITADFRFPIANTPDTVISVVVESIPFRDNAFVIDETLLNQAFVPDLIAKLDDNSKLTGQSGLHDLTTKTILITPDGAGATPRATTNQLRVNIELYYQRKPSATDGTTGGTTGSTTAGTTGSTTGTAPAAPTAPAPPTGGTTGGTTGALTVLPTSLGAAAPRDKAAVEGGDRSPGGLPPLEPVFSGAATMDARPLVTPRDAVVTPARRSPEPAPAHSGRAPAMTGLAGRATAPVAAPGVAPPRGPVAIPPPSAPRGPARTAPRPNSARPATRRSARPSAAPPAAETLPPLPADRRPARRSILSRIMGKN